MRRVTGFFFLTTLLQCNKPIYYYSERQPRSSCPYGHSIGSPLSARPGNNMGANQNYLDDALTFGEAFAHFAKAQRKTKPKAKKAKEGLCD